MRTLVLLLVCSLTVCAPADLTLVDKGRPVAVICVGANPSPHAEQAATELQTYLLKMSDARLEIVKAAPSGAGVQILVGQDAAAEEAVKAGVKIPSGLSPQFNDEGYVVATHGNCLILAGNETEPYQGTEYAVADFLESLGCRWFFPGAFGEVVPQLPTVTVKAVTRVGKPDFRVRDIWYSGFLPCTPQEQADFADWKRRNRLCRAGVWLHCEEPAAIYLQNPADNSTKKLLPRDRYFAEHPEYYALKPDGTRNPNYPCVSNPDALKACADTVIRYFREHPEAHSYGFSPPDEPVLCHCPDCRKAMNLGGFGGEGHGDVSDPYFTFVTNLADLVGAVYPDKYIITMAYYNRCRPPEGVAGKRKNLLIQYAFIQQCSNHAYNTPNCPSRDQFGALLAHWSWHADGLVAYDYDPHDWSNSQKPFWRSQGIAADMRFAKELGGWGFSDEGMMAWLVTGLNYYIRAKLAWNLNQDVIALESDFFDKFFGPAAVPMKSYYTGIEKALATTPLHLYSSYYFDDIFAVLDDKTMASSWKWLDEAALLAVDEPYKTRVTAFRAHFDRLDCAKKVFDTAALGLFVNAASSAQGMINAVKTVNNPMLLQDVGLADGACSGKSLRDFMNEVGTWANGSKGKLAAILPKTAEFKTDPGQTGVVHRWYLPNDASGGWRAISMLSSWYNQGAVTPEGAGYAGIAWYRAKVTLDADPPDSLTLLLPYIKASDVWVWVNGQYAGAATRTSAETAWNVSGLQVQVTGLLKKGDNVVVFRVNGNGGFVLPPFFFQ